MQLPYPRSLCTRRVSARAATATGSAEGRTREDALEEVAGRSPRIWMSEESESEAEEALASEDVVLASEEVVLASEEVVLASWSRVVVIRLVLRRGGVLFVVRVVFAIVRRGICALVSGTARAQPLRRARSWTNRARNRTSGRRRRISRLLRGAEADDEGFRTAPAEHQNVAVQTFATTPTHDVFDRDDPRRGRRATISRRPATERRVAPPRCAFRACAGPSSQGIKSRAAEEYHHYSFTQRRGVPLISPLFTLSPPPRILRYLAIPPPRVPNPETGDAVTPTAESTFTPEDAATSSLPSSSWTSSRNPSRRAGASSFPSVRGEQHPLDVRDVYVIQHDDTPRPQIPSGDHVAHHQCHLMRQRLERPRSSSVREHERFRDARGVRGDDALQHEKSGGVRAVDVQGSQARHQRAARGRHRPWAPQVVEFSSPASDLDGFSRDASVVPSAVGTRIVSPRGATRGA